MLFPSNMPTDTSQPESGQQSSTQTQSVRNTWPRPPWYAFQSAPSNEGPFISLPSLPATPTAPPTSLFLTPLYPYDASAMQHIMSNPRVNSVLLNVPKPYGIVEANSWISLCRGTFSSCLSMNGIRIHHPTDAGLYIGGISLTDRAIPGDPPMYELGYCLNPEFWGMGIMRNAVLALLTWASEEVGVEEVFVRVESTNDKSKSVIDGIPEFEREDDQDIDWKGEKKVMRVWRWKIRKSSA